MLLRVWEISHISERIRGLFFFLSPLRCLFWGDGADTLYGLLGWSRVGLQEAVMLLSSLDTAINMSLIPHVGLSTADNLLGEEFHLWWSAWGNPKKFLLDNSQFSLVKRGLDYVRYQTRFIFFFWWHEAKLKLTNNFWVFFFFFCLRQGWAGGSWAASTRRVIYLVIGEFIF